MQYRRGRELYANVTVRDLLQGTRWRISCGYSEGEDSLLELEINSDRGIQFFGKEVVGNPSDPLRWRLYIGDKSLLCCTHTLWFRLWFPWRAKANACNSPHPSSTNIGLWKFGVEMLSGMGVVESCIRVLQYSSNMLAAQ